MGIKGCTAGKALWLASGLSLKNLKQLQRGNKIDVDGNALAWKIGAGRPFPQVIELMATFLKSLAHSGGFEVTVIIDGQRPDCKRATLFRGKERQLDEINRVHCRLKCLELGTKKDEMSKKRYLLYTKESARLERKCRRSLSIPSDFGTRLSEQLMLIGSCDRNENGGFVNEEVHLATFQADSVIAKRFIEKKSNFILAEDTDFAGLIGDECILIKNVKEKAKSKRGRKPKKSSDDNSVLADATQYDVQLAGSCNKKMNQIRELLNMNTTSVSAGNESHKWEEATFPIFQFKCKWLRAMIALTLGCDVYEGVKGMGISTVHNKIIDLLAKHDGDESLVLSEYKMIITKAANIDESTLHALLMSFLFEPGEIKSKSDDDKITQSSYIYSLAPMDFPSYISKFAHNESNIVDGPAFCNCRGWNGRQHSYLSYEESY
jgi:hypothetical protein